jgi:lysophospholipase L1-like esterase
MQRFPTVLDADRPEVVLLLDGANDLLAAASTGAFGTAITRIITALDEMIKAADARGVDVMLATFPPQNPAGSRGGGAPAVPTLNTEIAKLAARQGATLVDLFNGLGGTPAGSIGVDGLHPTATGYTKIANIWFEAIKQRYERAPAATGMSPRLVIESARP